MTTRKLSNGSGRKMPEIPSEHDLVAFGHSAAGHEGISSNASGSLIIKPCVQAEIDFYNSAAAHPHFQAHMPDFIGVLHLEQDQDKQDKLKSFLDQQGGVAPVQQMLDTASQSLTSSTPPRPSTPLHTKRASWKPSGGKKLNTGLAIVLENAAAGFTHPNVLDVKLGTRLWDDDAPVAKRQKLDDVAHRTTSGSLGFRIAGMKLWLGRDGGGGTDALPGEKNVQVKDGYKCFDKNYGREFDAQTVKEAFAVYLGGKTATNGTSSAAGKAKLNRVRGKLIAQRLLRDLESVQYVIEHEESRMYSASILMVYEGDEAALEVALREEEMAETARAEHEARASSTGDGVSDAVHDGSFDHDHDEDEDDEDYDEVGPKVHDVRLIDFAHAKWTPGLGPDENMLRGVRSVIVILKGFVDD